MLRVIHRLLVVWRGELPGLPVGAAVRHTDCCAFFPRCKVGARQGHIVATHNDDAVVFIHFDDGEYGARPKSEVSHVWDMEVSR